MYTRFRLKASGEPRAHHTVKTLQTPPLKTKLYAHLKVKTSGGTSQTLRPPHGEDAHNSPLKTKLYAHLNMKTSG